MKTAAKMIALAPFVEGQPHSDITFADNLQLIKNTGTTWVRLWADWPTCWPELNWIDEDYMAKLSHQIDVARAAGLKVMLTTLRFPRWANHSTEPDNWKASLQVPNFLGINSLYGRWIKLLVERFGPRLARLEICNELNTETMGWPQEGMPARVAMMFKTAQRIVAAHGYHPRIGGPALADWGFHPEKATDFTEQVVHEMKSIGFVAHSSTLWTHHNYQDLLRKRWDGNDTTQAIRHILRMNGWQGSTGPMGPYIAITESGVVREAAVARYGGTPDQAQFDLLSLGMQQTRRNNGPGEGVAMIANYLLRSEANYNSGLLGPDGEERPAYWRWSQ